MQTNLVIQFFIVYLHSGHIVFVIYEQYTLFHRFCYFLTIELSRSLLVSYSLLLVASCMYYFRTV